eukprot:TRINITY_DN479_c0_g1_i5.p1 TRINITY_DN479_c0_g1~~TRINITY_DN479_c0_g1_i5.p1  ORF type:complete len:511 (+),score=65.55 TRINITY_DN479_c0_g1_i5:20-1552(+)
MSSASSVDSVTLECSICTRSFNSKKVIPKLLPSCGHSFCFDCLDTILKQHDDGYLYCPLRCERMRCESVNELKTNFALMDILDALEARANCKSTIAAASGSGSSSSSSLSISSFVSVSNSSSESKSDSSSSNSTPDTCSQCHSEVATIYCKTCASVSASTSYCKKCYDLLHSNVLCRSHDHVPISDRPLEYAKCLKHSELSKYYCENCKQYLCVDCWKFDGHEKSKHDIQLVKDVFDFKVKAFHDKLAQLKLSSSTMDTLIKSQKSAIQNISDESKAVISAAKQHFDKVVDAVQTRSNAAQEEIKAEEERRIAFVQERLKNQNDAVLLCSSVENEVTQLLKKCQSSFPSLSSLSSIEQRMNQALDNVTKWGSIEPIESTMGRSQVTFADYQRLLIKDSTIETLKRPVIALIDKEDEEKTERNTKTKTVESILKKAYADKLCTYSKFGREYMLQSFYRCRTCNLLRSNNLGCCVTCARTCHEGHDLQGPEFCNSGFFCDCGAGHASFLAAQ